MRSGLPTSSTSEVHGATETTRPTRPSAATTVRSTSTPSRDPASIVTRSGPAGPDGADRDDPGRHEAGAGQGRALEDAGRGVQGRDLALRGGEAGGERGLLGPCGRHLVVTRPEEPLERAEDGGGGAAHRLEPGGAGRPEGHDETGERPARR